MTVTLMRPPRPWELQTAALLAGAAATTLLTMIILGVDVALLAYVRSAGASGMTPSVNWALQHLVAIHFVRSLLFGCCVVLAILWRVRTQAMLRRIGDVSGSAARHWLLMGFWVSCSVIFLVGVNDVAAGDGLTSQLTFDAIYAAVRTAGLAFLLLGLWQIRTQIRTAVAEAGVLLRRTDLPKRSTVPARPLPALDAPVSNLPPADDDYWSAISRLAITTGADLALLEAAGPLSHRWHLIPKTGDVAATRKEIPPGAVMTVFPNPPSSTAPPSDTEATGFTLPSADKYHSLLVTATRALQYQSVPEKRVPAFLARARTASLWALYPTDAAGALRAVMPELTPDLRPTTEAS